MPFVLWKRKTKFQRYNRDRAVKHLFLANNRLAADLQADWIWEPHHQVADHHLREERQPERHHQIWAEQRQDYLRREEALPLVRHLKANNLIYPLLMDNVA
jgi:hypothetical protein